MRLIKPLSTTAVRFVSAPKGSNHVFVPDLVKGVRERYSFWEAPQAIEQFNLNSGAKFRTGIFNHTKLDVVTVYTNGVSVEGEANTSDLDSFLDDLLGWVAGAYDLEFVPSQPLAKGFTSIVEVTSEARLGKYLDQFTPLMERLTKMVAGYGITLATYRNTGLIAQTEASVAKPIVPGRFIFENRGGQLLDSGIYYSEAPVSTNEHMELLDMLEAILTGPSL